MHTWLPLALFINTSVSFNWIDLLFIAPFRQQAHTKYQGLLYTQYFRVHTFQFLRLPRSICLFSWPFPIILFVFSLRFPPPPRPIHICYRKWWEGGAGEGGVVEEEGGGVDSVYIQWIFKLSLRKGSVLDFQLSAVHLSTLHFFCLSYSLFVNEGLILARVICG